MDIAAGVVSKAVCREIFRYMVAPGLLECGYLPGDTVVQVVGFVYNNPIFYSL